MPGFSIAVAGIAIPQLVSLVGVALLVVTAGWAWSETIRRLREAEARIGTRPRFAMLALVLFSALAVMTALAAEASTDQGRPTTWTYLLYILPIAGFVLVASLSRTGRTSRWIDFLLERQRRVLERRIAAERQATLAESVQRGLDLPIHTLAGTLESFRDRPRLPNDLAEAFLTIDAQVSRLRQIQEQTGAWTQKEQPQETTNVEDACSELLARVRGLHGRHIMVRLFGIENLDLKIPRRHFDTILLGGFEAAFISADETDPVIEIMIGRHGGILFIDFENNGGYGASGGSDEPEAVRAARLILELHGGALKPASPPYGSKLRVSLPGTLVA